MKSKKDHPWGFKQNVKKPKPKKGEKCSCSHGKGGR